VQLGDRGDAKNPRDPDLVDVILVVAFQNDSVVM
jgi:hypothetical protein